MRLLFEGLEGVLLLLVITLGWPLAGRRLRNLGATQDEIERSWPGDALLSARQQTTTRAIGIDAPPAAIWPWLVQIGLGRAGFYSYELLERLGGIPVTNLEVIEPKLQALSVGDEIDLHPDAPSLVLAQLEPERALCFSTCARGASEQEETTADRSWSFYLGPSSSHHTRLLVRNGTEPSAVRSPFERLLRGVEAALDCVMEQRMLRTVKRLAESSLPKHP